MNRDVSFLDTSTVSIFEHDIVILQKYKYTLIPYPRSTV